MPAPPSAPHARAAEVVAAGLGTDLERGLSAEEARRRLLEHGPNELPDEPRRPGWRVLVAQFESPLIYLLFAAAAIALALGERADAAVIGVVVVANALIGAFQEGRAERSLAALKRLTALRARVVRDGREGEIDAREIVIGDLLALGAGDAAAADARLVEAVDVEADESTLTGESVPVAKSTEPVQEDAALGDRTSMLRAGTHVVSGRARAVVVATGAATEVGRIAALAGRATVPKTPLERRIEHFGRVLLISAGGLFVLVAAIGAVRRLPFADLAMVAISQVVGMIPEGLPVAMTIALAVGVQRMAKRGAIVRRLGAVETLGSITVICADKTGTLTKNEMTVRRIAILPDRALDVEGLGYAPEGTIVERGRPVAALDPQLDALLTASVLCNDALLEAPATPADPWRVIGDPTEGALVVLARKAGLDEEELRRRSPRVAEQPFSSASKRMATVHRMDGKLVTYVKGAPEAVLPHCGMTDELRQRAQEVTLELASDALRVLAVARIEGVDASGGLDGLAGRMTLLGLLGQIDPPRAETKKAIEDCRAAGIRPVMITGDHAATARAIALDLGLMAEGDRTMDGRELAHASDAELDAAVTHVSVYARVEPADKLRIVGALQRAGAVVAMTGDGVNDAPALVHADVGVAMGRSGTEVAKQAAKIVVTDDDFATIVAAVREGRVVYANLRKVILLLLSTSIAEVVVLTLALLLGYPPPFFAVQILWNNLVTEGVITVNLVLDPPEGDEMARPPTPLDEPLVNRSMLRRIALMTSAIVVSTLGWFIIRVESGVPFRQAQVEAFTVLAVCEWYNVLSCRSEHRTALSSSIFRNRYLLAGLVVGNLLQVLVIFAPPMNRLFHTQPFDLAQVTVIGVVASLVLWAEEIRKFFVRRALHDR